MRQSDRLFICDILVLRYAAPILVVLGLQRDKLVQILVRLLRLFTQLHHLLHLDLICFILGPFSIVHILDFNLTLAPLNVLNHGIALGVLEGQL